MPSLEEVMKELGKQLDKKLQDLKIDYLLRILLILASKMDKRSLTKLISDDAYFPLARIVTLLEKQDLDGKEILFEILDEPAAEIDLRKPVDAWLTQEHGMQKTAYEVPLPVAGRSRAIDVCGYKSGRLGEVKVIAVELKIDPQRGSIDKAFGQALDNAKGANESYVVFSPYVYLKQAEAIMKKNKDHKEVGVLIVNKRGVTIPVSKPSEWSLKDYHDTDVLNAVKEWMKQSK